MSLTIVTLQTILIVIPSDESIHLFWGVVRGALCHQVYVQGPQHSSSIIYGKQRFSHSHLIVRNYNSYLQYYHSMNNFQNISKNFFFDPPHNFLFVQFCVTGGSESFKDKQIYFYSEVRRMNQQNGHGHLMIKVNRDRFLESVSNVLYL